jgi:hypothetical protein
MGLGHQRGAASGLSRTPQQQHRPLSAVALAHQTMGNAAMAESMGPTSSDNDEGLLGLEEEGTDTGYSAAANTSRGEEDAEFIGSEIERIEDEGEEGEGEDEEEAENADENVATGSCEPPPGDVQDLPEAPAGAAEAGIVKEEFKDGAFKSYGALGYIDLSTSMPRAPSVQFLKTGRPEVDESGKSWTRVKFDMDTFVDAADASYTTVASPAGTYDTGQTVTVNVKGQPREVKKLVTVTAADAAKIRMFEQQHIDDSIAAFEISLGAVARAIQGFSDTTFIGETQSAAEARAWERVAEDVGDSRIGLSPDAWMGAYKKLLNLTISQRDNTGTHTWSLAPNPAVSSDGGAVTYSLAAPSGAAGASFQVISYGKI